MFNKTSPQSSIFEVENIFPEVLPQDDWCYTFKNKILPLIDENKFRHFYSDTTGRPNASIKTMVSLLIFMGMEKLSWRAVEYQFQRRFDWMIATNTPLDKSQIDHTTIFQFYQRLEDDNTVREFFIEVTDQFIKACGTSLDKQRTDSFFIHGWLRILSRYGLFKESIRKFLQALKKQKQGLYAKIKKELSQEYLEKDFDLTEKDKDLAHRKITLMAKDLFRIKSAFENHKQIKNYETFQTLCKVFSQQCEVKENDVQEPEIIIKDKPDTDTICTPHNTEARYVRKVKQKITGDKAFVTETCDPENQTQFITDIEVTASTKHDSKEQAEIQKRLFENGYKPEKQYADAGFVNGQTIMESQENEIELEGPTAGRSQSFEAYESKGRRYDAGDFETIIDDESKELTIVKCPNNQEPKDQKRSSKTGKVIVHFDINICTVCKHAKRCPVTIGKRKATYKVEESEYIGATRHHQYMSDPEYRKECAVRAGAEATVSELTRSHGMRKSRHRKRSRTKLQLLFAAIACNVKRFIKHGDNYVYLETKFA
jgi:hypothetical protein